MNTPLLSIIVPVWNAGKVIEPMVNSLLGQPFKELELILVDDGSTDNTLVVLRDIEKRDQRVRVYTKSNGGPSSARNLGLKRATGKYVQFYDSDDNIPANALPITTSAITQNDYDLLVSGWQIDLQSSKGLIKSYKQISPRPEIITEDIPTYTLRSLGNDGTLYNLWNKLFRADIIRDNSLLFREDLRFGEDVLFSLEYLKHIQTLRVIPDITYNYQTNSKTSVFSSSSLVPEYRLVNDKAIVNFAGSNPSKTRYELLTWLRWRWLMSYWSLVAASNKKIGEKVELIRQFQPDELSVVHNVRLIGLKKYLMMLVANTARNTALGSLAAGWCSNLLKKIIITTKTTLKKQRDI